MPLENALNGIPWLKIIRSKSVLGLSSVVLIFEDGTDLIRARQLVQERLAAETSRLPAVARPPVMLSPLSSTSRVLKIGVTSRHAFADGHDDPRPVDDPPAVDGDSRRGERGHLGAARSAVSGAGRSRASAGARRHAGGRRARRDRGHGPGRRRILSTRPISALARAAIDRHAARRRIWPMPLSIFGPGAVATGRRCRRCRRLSAADRRRGNQRRAGLAADRRKATLGQHAGRDAQGRSGAG